MIKRKGAAKAAPKPEPEVEPGSVKDQVEQALKIYKKDGVVEVTAPSGTVFRISDAIHRRPDIPHYDTPEIAFQVKSPYGMRFAFTDKEVYWGVIPWHGASSYHSDPASHVEQARLALTLIFCGARVEHLQCGMEVGAHHNWITR